MAEKWNEQTAKSFTDLATTAKLLAAEGTNDFNFTKAELITYLDTLYTAVGDVLLAANNLSDLDDLLTAQQNLELEKGVDVQAFDADTMKTDVAETITAVKTFTPAPVFTNGFSNGRSGTSVITLGATTTNGTHTYSANAISWTRLGDLVFCTYNLNISSLDASIDGTLRISGLPFTTLNDAGHRPGGDISLSKGLSFTNVPYIYLAANNDYFELRDGKADGSNSVYLTDANLTDTSPTIQGGFWYITGEA